MMFVTFPGTSTLSSPSLGDTLRTTDSAHRDLVRFHFHYPQLFATWRQPDDPQITGIYNNPVAGIRKQIVILTTSPASFSPTWGCQSKFYPHFINGNITGQNKSSI